MDLKLTGRAVLVAGSSRGIGRAIAESFLAEGACVTITGRCESSVSETGAQLALSAGPERVQTFAGDLTDCLTCDRCVAATIDRWGKLDVLIANVGDGNGMRGWAADDQEWKRSIDQNLFSALRMVRAVLPCMIEKSQGSIVLVSSIAGREALGAPLPYSVSKAGVVVLAKELSRELGRHNIRINAVAPGNILFPGGTWDRKFQADCDGVHSYISKEVPLGRLGRPEEIADLVTYLASDRALFLTGACIIADGGQTRGY